MVNDNLLFLDLSTYGFNEPDFSVADQIEDSIRLAERQKNLDSVLRGQGNLEDYLDLLSENGIDVDDYLEYSEEVLGCHGIL